MCLSKEGQHVVFAHRVYFDVLDKHHFGIRFVKNGRFNELIGILFVAAREKLHGFGDAFGCFEQAFSARVFAELGNDCFVEVLQIRIFQMNCFKLLT